MDYRILSKVIGFNWDFHNLVKNQIKHQVEPGECEELFFNKPLVIVQDTKHSGQEDRYHALGITDAGRVLLVVFTLRELKIRVISSRDGSRKERSTYEKHQV